MGGSGQGWEEGSLVMLEAPALPIWRPSHLHKNKDSSRGLKY